MVLFNLILPIQVDDTIEYYSKIIEWPTLPNINDNIHINPIPTPICISNIIHNIQNHNNGIIYIYLQIITMSDDILIDFKIALNQCNWEHFENVSRDYK